MMKRKVFLFGAGAVLDWEAPSTSCLTDAIIQSGFLIADQSKTVTQLLYETLINRNENLEKIVNFETIINAIEELIVHYANLHEWERNPFHKNHLSNFHQMLFQTNLTEKIFGCKKGEFRIKGNRGTDGFFYIDFNGKKE